MGKVTPQSHSGALNRCRIPCWGIGQAVPNHQCDGTSKRPSVEDAAFAGGTHCPSHGEGNQTTASSPATGWDLGTHSSHHLGAKLRACPSIPPCYRTHPRSRQEKSQK